MIAFPGLKAWPLPILSIMNQSTASKLKFAGCTDWLCTLCQAGYTSTMKFSPSDGLLQFQDKLQTRILARAALVSSASWLGLLKVSIQFGYIHVPSLARLIGYPRRMFTELSQIIPGDADICTQVACQFNSTQSNFTSVFPAWLG